MFSVNYFENFLSVNEADSFFEELNKLNFSPISVQVYGKKYQPKRKCLAFADENIHYEFSGCIIPTYSWPSYMVKMKEAVESATNSEFNYALLNLYPDGSSGIGLHKDNETSLDPDSPIACVNFGGTRKLQFFDSEGKLYKELSPTHGSLYVMEPPTNIHYSHKIPNELNVKSARISVTFRKIVQNPPKKRRVTSSELCVPSNDWLERYVIQEEEKIPLFTHDMGYETKLIVKLFKGELYIHIRKFVNGQFTKTGITMTPQTWYYFERKLFDLNVFYNSYSCIVNNSLVCTVHDQKVVFQNCEVINDSLQLKANSIYLFGDQILDLKNAYNDITNQLLEYMYLKKLPSLIPVHVNSEMSEKLFFSEIANNICELFSKMFECSGCACESFSQLNHNCIMLTNVEKYYQLGRNILLCCNIVNLSKCISSIPPNFFIDMTVEKIICNLFNE